MIPGFPARKHLTLVLLLFSGALGLTSCATTTANHVTIKKLPAWIEPTQTEVITIAEIRKRLTQDFPGVPVRSSDKHYKRVSYLWLQKFLHWMWAMDLELGGKYVSESFDCEDFSIAFVLFANRAAAMGGQETAPLIARLKVRQEHAFGGVPGRPGSIHELVAVATDSGVFVVEPQPHASFRIAPIETYQNRIIQIVLGD